MADRRSNRSQPGSQPGSVHRRPRNQHHEDGLGPGSSPVSATAPALSAMPSAASTSAFSSSAATAALPPERQPLLHRNTFPHALSPEPVYSCITDPHTHLPVYTNIHRIRRDIVSVVEDYLSPEQLRDMRINISVVRPLVDKLYELDDISIIYCLLVNRARFLHEQSQSNNRQNVNFTRAALCELIAHRILRRFNEDNDGLDGLILLSHILVAGFEPFQNAPESVRREAAELSGTWLHTRTLPALEVAILSESKLFLSSTACQKVIEAIYVGRVTYTPSSFINLIPDHYKQKPIALHDPRETSFLNHYRLGVPRTRNILEALQFIILLTLYLFFMAERDPSRCSMLELAFSIYSFGWVLDQFATILGHGWHVYTQNLWSFLDVIYAGVYGPYLLIRIYGWIVGSVVAGQQALDVMAMAAPVLVPRLAFTILSDNLLFVSLRSMMADFTLLTFLAAWCFGGFLLSLVWLGEGEHPVLTISKWMVYIWFGLDGTGIQRSTELHWLFGPSLMVAFAFLGNTLFLTILVSMLSNTFSTIVSNATAEIQFRKAVLTLEGVKSDAIFAYQPPFNILAMLILVPLKFLVSARWFHKIHVACVRTINLPTLLIIAVAERRLLWPARPRIKHYSVTSLNDYRHAKRPFWDKWRITAHSDIQTVFEMPPPDSVGEEIAADDDLTRHLIRKQFTRQHAADKLATVITSDGPDGEDGTEGARFSGDGSSDKGSGSSTPKALAAAAAAATAVILDAVAGDGNQHAGNGKNAELGIKRSDNLATSTELTRPRPVNKPGISRRDSIAFPGLDPDKLRTMLRSSMDSAAVDGAHADGDGTTNVGMARRLDSLEDSILRIEAMLSRLVDAPPTSAEEYREMAHSATDDVIDDEELTAAEQTGTMTDLDLSADDR